ncbi:MAG: AAA family ATPase [Saprospiraceae bacterium]|nr:AAA family ATPase [Saprospiraceae bacterium]
MDVLVDKYLQKINLTPTEFVRSIMNQIQWNARLIGIKGARGTGKTTLLLQYIKLNLSDRLEQTLYVSLDSLWFNEHSLPELVDQFIKRGGKYLFLDEVHRYKDWSQLLKNFYDDYPELKIVFTGSSLLEILNERADLSRRAIVYHMQGLSFREYLSLETGEEFEILHLHDILHHQLDYTRKILQQVRPFKYFSGYLQNGYYPFYREEITLYQRRLTEIVNMILEVELPLLRSVDIAYVEKIKLLMSIIAESAPFVPNTSKISERIGINRLTLLSYLKYLDECGLTRNLFKNSQGLTKLQKPDKIYLENTNIAYLFSGGKTNVGYERETFFANQLAYQHTVTYSNAADFMIDNQYTFEIGGKNKSQSQVMGIKDSFIVKDGIEYGQGNVIPLWLFGFLY